ncbi:helix-turn-helix domain-containing protein [Paenibacillus naphthalenovorans]|uniref:helix-turn-helix domain-containing protein n=1 Tax=Paenibacillus naphthalenovorans TaxID=162209 RepID=UPI003D299B65
MGADLYATLTVIAAHMDADGHCYPTQASIGRMLGVNRQTANKYVQRLLAYRWRGEPVIVAEKVRGPGGRFDRNVYTVTAASGLAIF